MDVQEVIFRLKRNGQSQKSIAAQLGVSHGAVNNTLHGRTRSRQVAVAIAAAVRLPLERVFPGTYES